MPVVFEHQANVTKVGELKTLVLDHDLIKFDALVYRHSGIIKMQHESIKPPKEKKKTPEPGQLGWLIAFVPFLGIFLYRGSRNFDISSELNTDGVFLLFGFGVLLLILFFQFRPAPAPVKKPKEEAILHIHLATGDRFVVTSSPKAIKAMQTYIEQFMTGTNEHKYVAIDTQTGDVKFE